MICFEIDYKQSFKMLLEAQLKLNNCSHIIPKTLKLLVFFRMCKCITISYQFVLEFTKYPGCPKNFSKVWDWILKCLVYIFVSLSKNFTLIEVGWGWRRYLKIFKWKLIFERHLMLKVQQNANYPSLNHPDWQLTGSLKIFNLN